MIIHDNSYYQTHENIHIYHLFFMTKDFYATD